MKHHIAIVATFLALAANAAFVRQATEEYPANTDTNTVKAIVNAEVGGTNTLVHTPQIANLATTNYVRSALGSVAYVTNTANGAFVDADLNARVVIPTTSWNPAEIITRNGEAYGRCDNVRWESSKWICDTWVKLTETSSWIFLQSYDMTGPGASDFSATTLTFPNNLGTTTRVVGANYLTKIADTNYVQAVAVATTNTAFAAASAYADTSANKAFVDATNSTSRIALHGAIIYGDLTVETHSGWYPLYGYYSDTRRIGNPTWASSSQRWYCRMQEWNGTGWANIGGGWATGPGASDPDGVDINYPNGTKAHRYVYDYAVDKLATTNELHYTKAQLDSRINAVTNTVTQLSAYIGGSDVRVSVTNLYSELSTDIPKLRIQQMVSNDWYTVWDEDSKYGQWYTNTAIAVAAMTNSVRSDLTQWVTTTVSNKAPLAWGTVTSTGMPAPENTVWHTAGKTVFGGGTEFQMVAVGSGSIGVLVNNGAVVYAQGNPGTFFFETVDFSHHFGIRVEDVYMLGCDTDGITVEHPAGGYLITLTYNVTMSGKPCLYYKASLATTNAWEQLNDSTGTPIPGASKTISWEANPPAGKEICYIPMSTDPQGFFTANVEVAGTESFETDLVIDAKGGYLATNQTTGVMTAIEPYISGGEVKWRIKP